MKRKNIMICLVIGMMLIVSLNVIINYPVVSAGRWKYTETVEDVYNVTLSSDDAVNVMDSYFSSTGETIALKIETYDMMIGLRFDNVSIPFNATHNYLVVNAYISLYSDHHPYELDSGRLTIYYQRYSWNISTFSTYIDLTQRYTSENYRNWNLDDVHGLNSTTGQWNDSPNIAILVSEAIEYDNNTIAFILLSQHGSGFRYFRTIDSSSDYAPRLHIISQIYEYQESPPSGYDEYDFIEIYEEYDIWLYRPSIKIDMSYWDGSNEQYMEINTNSTDVEITGVTTQGNRPASYQIIRGPDDDIFYLGRVGSNQTLFHSYDEGLTWDNYILNDQYDDIEGESNKDGSLAFDSSGDLWVVWVSTGTYDPIPGNYFCISITINISNHVLIFSNDWEFVGRQWNANQNRPSLWIDSNDRKHLAFDAGWSPTASDPKIQYSFKDAGAWSAPILLSNEAERDYFRPNIATSDNGTFKIVVWTSDNSETTYSYYKTEWVKHQDLSTAGDEWGPHVSYNENNDKVLIVWQLDSDIRYKIFNFSDSTLSAQKNTGVDGVDPDLTFDINSNKTLMVYDGGADGLNGTIFNWDTESWGSTFSIRDINPGYIHIVSRGTIDIGGEEEGNWIVVDEDENIIVILDIDDYPTIDDVEAWIDNYLSASSEYDKTPWMGDFTLLLVGLVGIAMIPIGFLMFVSSVRDGDIISGLTTLVLTFFIGMGCVVAWLWG